MYTAPIANDAMTFFVPILGGLFTGGLLFLGSSFLPPLKAQRQWVESILAALSGFTAAGSYAYMKWDGSFNQKEILVVAVSGGLVSHLSPHTFFFQCCLL